MLAIYLTKTTVRQNSQVVCCRLVPDKTIILKIIKRKARKKWNFICFRSRITHSCNEGRVFSDTFKASKVNTCQGSSDGAKWEYDADNKLPNCIRKLNHFQVTKKGKKDINESLQPTALISCPPNPKTRRKQLQLKGATSLVRK